MKPTKKDLQNATKFVNIICDDDPASNKFAIIKNGRIVLTPDELAEICAMHTLHLEAKGIIKFTARRDE